MAVGKPPSPSARLCKWHPHTLVEVVKVAMQDDVLIGNNYRRYTAGGGCNLPQQVIGKTIEYVRCPVCDVPPEKEDG